jgi:PAP2 superfamily
MKKCVLVLAVLGCVTPAWAQSTERTPARCDGVRSWHQLFGATLASLRRVPSHESFGIAGVGSIAAIGAHAVDRNVTRSFTGSTLDEGLEPGAVLGGSPLQFGAAFGAYAIGRALDRPCLSSLGADLIQAQVVAETLTTAIKHASRRDRPDGSRLSFPSGHTSVTFASATILQRRLGWKAGVPAYAVASYVAASRVEMKRHYLSDVVFGAAVGIIAGRSVRVGGQQWIVTPMTTPDSNGVGLSFTRFAKR